MWSRVFPSLNRRCQAGDIWLMIYLQMYNISVPLTLFCLQKIIQLWEVPARKIYSACRFIGICFSCIKHNKSFQIGMCFRSNGVENSNKVLPPAVAILVNWIIKYFWMVYFSLLLDFLLWEIRQSHNKIIGTLHITIKYKCINIIWTKNYSGQLP